VCGGDITDVLVDDRSIVRIDVGSLGIFTSANISLCSEITNFDTVINAYDECPFDCNSTLISTNDDSTCSFNSLYSELAISSTDAALLGSEFYILVEPFSEGRSEVQSEGNQTYQLSLSCIQTPTLSPTTASPTLSPTNSPSLSPTSTPIVLNGTIQVSSFYKISSTSGGFNSTLLDTSDYFGDSVSMINDVNGDNIDDIIVGTANDDDGGLDTGAVYILLLQTAGLVKTYAKISALSGMVNASLESGDSFGAAVIDMGDIDNDDINDIGVGAARDDDGIDGVPITNAGAVYIIYLQSSGNVKTYVKISATSTDFFTAGLSTDDQFGWSITSLKDIDSDGVNDIAVGAPGVDDIL